MSRVSFFQRFSQAENHATNNTLLMLRYFYEASPFRLQKLLTSMLDVDLAVGLSFDQQIRVGHGVPDALITQEALRIFVETKRHGALDPAQIRRHCEGIAEDGKRKGDFLIGLTKGRLSEPDRQALLSEAAAHGITFVSVTFSGIVEALRQQCAEYERDLLAVVEDYETYLTEENLLDDGNRWLLVFPCGTSMTENAKYSLYYEPPSRRLVSNCRYLGIYKQKAVNYIGRIRTIVVVTPSSEGKLSFIEEFGNLSEDEKNRIHEVIAETKYYNLGTEALRYYLADKLHPTRSIKTSPGGIRGRTYLDLPRLSKSYDAKEIYTSEQVAHIIDGTTWE